MSCTYLSESAVALYMYVGMALGGFIFPIHWHRSKFENTQQTKERRLYIELYIELSYCKLT